MRQRDCAFSEPPANAAIIEGSKAFFQDLMKKYGIPTAAYETFDDADKALAYLETASFPIVLKASGLALGKGVLICEDLASAKDGIRELMMDKKFGDAGNSVVIEQFMTGREVSVLAFVDGTHYQLMTSSQDHKRQGDGDTGLNTGGMGTFSPSPFYTPRSMPGAVRIFTTKLWRPWLQRDVLSAVSSISAS